MDVTKCIFVSETRSVYFHTSIVTGVCKYYIGPIGDLSLLTAAAARIHSLH